jgi:Ca2+-binding RTX toxin-like protein
MAESISITDFGAVGDGKTDNRAAIQKAIDTAKQTGQSVTVPAGTFVHQGLLKLDGVDMAGAGGASVLKAVGSGDQSVELTGNGASLSNITLDSDATSRGTKNTNAKILVNAATNFDVDHVTILNSFSAGMMIYGSSEGQIVSNTVQDTNADSIHMTGGSHDILVQGNLVQRAGDDGIAVVSYGTSNVAHDITITGNAVVDNKWGRNVTVVGGEDVKITGNYIDGNSAGLAGVYLATEPAYNTAGDKNVLVDGNTIKNTGSTRTGHGNVMLYDGTAQTLSGITITNNVIEGMAIRSNGSGISTDTRDNKINTGAATAMPAVGAAAGAIPAPASAASGLVPEMTAEPAAPTATSGADTLTGGDTADQLAGGHGDDVLTGNPGADTLFGGQGSDQLFGNRGADQLAGDLGDDLVRGGRGDDLLDGGAGNDTLGGDLGDDRLTGGAGADRFLYRPGDGNDTITDFSFGDGDRIQLADGAGFTVDSTAGGDALLQVTGGGSITLTGILSGDVQPSWIAA